MIDEEDPESQDSHGWLETGKSPPKGSAQEPGPSNYQGRQTKDTAGDWGSPVGVTGSIKAEHHMLRGGSENNANATVDLLQEINELAEKMKQDLISAKNVTDVHKTKLPRWLIGALWSSTKISQFRYPSCQHL